MGRDDGHADPMEIDGQQQLQLESPAAVPEGFNADYLRVYYGNVICSLLMRGIDKINQNNHTSYRSLAILFLWLSLILHKLVILHLIPVVSEFVSVFLLQGFFFSSFQLLFQT